MVHIIWPPTEASEGGRPDGYVDGVREAFEAVHDGDQEGAAWNGRFECTCYHPNFLFHQFGMPERCALRNGNVHSADGWAT